MNSKSNDNSKPDEKRDDAALPPDCKPIGSDKPGFFFFNRVGEPFMVEPFKNRDRANILYFVPPMAGKCSFTSDILQFLVDETLKQNAAL